MQLKYKVQTNNIEWLTNFLNEALTLTRSPYFFIYWKVDTSQLLVVDQALIDSFMGAFSELTKNLFSFFFQQPASI